MADVDLDCHPSLGLSRPSTMSTPSHDSSMIRNSSQIQNFERVSGGATCSTLEPSMTNIGSTQGAPSSPLRYAGAAEVTTSPQSARPEPFRKYRINKNSHTVVTTPWQSEDESLLSQVLEQERLAWLTGPSRHSQQSNSSEEQGNPPTSIDYEEHDEVHASQRNKGNLFSSSKMEVPRRSFFLEGSMNEASKAISSTWHETQASSDQAPNIDSENDSEATPRPSIAGSTNSSIDVNEFKPLPPIPSAFATTIKRFGQKLKQKDPECSPTTKVSITHPPEKELQPQTRRGLRKSLSSWKMFSSSTSDAESKTTSDAEYDDNESMKTTNTARTLRSMISKPRFKSDNPQRAMLDDRKRKAEIAYAEQFGTANKRPKQNDLSFNSSLAPTLRRVAPSRRSTTKPVLPTVRGTDQASTIDSPSTFRLQPRATAAENPVTEPLPQIPHLRPNSRNSDRSLESRADRRKRTSRSELEKENQQLRSMLRESQSQAHSHKSTSQSYKANGGRSAQPPNLDDGSRVFLPSSECLVAEDRTPSIDTVQESGSTGSSHRPLVRSPSRTPDISRGRVNQTNVRVSPSAPTLPKLPSGRSILSSITGNSQPSYDTATMKRHGDPPRLRHVIELPRSLPMVLEGVENDNGRDVGEDSGDQSKRSSSKRKIRSLHDGTTDGDEAERKQEMLPMVVSRSSEAVAQRPQWQWPDDVF